MVSIARVGLPQTGDVIYKQLLGANTVAASERELSRYRLDKDLRRMVINSGAFGYNRSDFQGNPGNIGWSIRAWGRGRNAADFKV